MGWSEGEDEENRDEVKGEGGGEEKSELLLVGNEGTKGLGVIDLLEEIIPSLTVSTACSTSECLAVLLYSTATIQEPGGHRPHGGQQFTLSPFSRSVVLQLNLELYHCIVLQSCGKSKKQR